ncbi:MAG: hypothetical protein U0270_36560 [Labilithrix sp.]
MNTFLRITASVSLVAALFGAFTIGCSAESTEEQSSSASEINGSLVEAQGCAVKNAYLAADVGDFTVVQSTDIPFHAPAPASAKVIYARFPVEGLGDVYYVEYSYLPPDAGPGASIEVGTFYDRTGHSLLVNNTYAHRTSFFLPGHGGPLQCESGSSSSSSSGGSSGWSSSGWSSSGASGSSGWSSSGASGWSSSSSGWHPVDAGATHD